MTEHLAEGARRFAAEIVPAHQALFDDLATGQSPPTLFVTCADSRIDPSWITETLPGDLFVVRNAGNIVPRLDDEGVSGDGSAGSIEYAVAALGVQHIVVCGHSGCGAMGALQDPSGLDALPSVARWLQQVDELAPKAAELGLEELVQCNVLLQLERLAGYPSVAAKLDAGELHLHGWVYDIGSGVVERFDGNAFVPI